MLWGKLEQAKGHLVEALRIYEKINEVGGMAHTHLFLGKVLRKEKKFIEARTALEKSLAMFGYLPKDHPYIADCCAALGAYLAQDGSKDELPRSRELLERAVRIYTIAYGEEHDTTTAAKADLQALLARMASLAQ
jgi:tetratricopeptide (TPR) repeat protein